MAADPSEAPQAHGRSALTYARAVVLLRYPLVLACVAGALAVSLLLPAPEAGSLPLGGLVVDDSPAQLTAERERELFDVPLVADTVVVQRKPGGLPANAQRRVGEAALAASDGEGAVRLALPLTNALGVLPGSKETGTATVTYLFFDPEASLQERTDLARTYAASIREVDPEAYVGSTGPAPARLRAFELIRQWLPVVEAATVLAIALVVGLALRSLLAPVVTLLGAGLAYLLASRASAELGERLGASVPEEVEPVIVALTLGLITDYSVFYLAAARRRLARGDGRRGVVDAVAGVTPVVATAGLIVALGTLVLVVADLDLFRVIGVVLAVTAAASLLVAVTFVPAAAAIAGDRLLWPGSRRAAELEARVSPLRESASRFVVSRVVAVPILALCVVGLLVASARSGELELGFRATEALPREAEPRRAADEAASAFAAGILAPTVIVVDGPGIGAEAAAHDAMRETLARVPGVAGVIGPGQIPGGAAESLFVSEDGNAVRYALVLQDAPLGSDGIDTVGAIRERLPALVADAGLTAASASVTGQTAIAADTVEAIIDAVPIVAVAALLVNFVLLAVFLRALVAPLYLLAASVLSVTATLGVTVVVFQELLGHGDVTYYVPFAAGVLLLALGSDYNVFLVGRIWQQARTTALREAIALTVPRASKAITIAGVALALSFGALAIVPLGTMREFAFFMGFGVLLETFVVRPLVVPALVSLFGRTSAWPGSIRRVDEAGAAPSPETY